MTYGRSIIGFSYYRYGPDKLVHIASQTTFDHPYAGWWASRCGQSYVKAEPRVSRETVDAPTCLQCIAAIVPASGG
jgi:hypothetical protein